MRTLLLLIILLAAGAWFYPPYAENTDNVCAAFEKKISVLAQAEAQRLLPAGRTNDPRVAALMDTMKATLAATNGALAQAYIRDKFPALAQLPPSLGCVAGYWKFTIDPDLSAFTKGRMPR